MSTVEEDEDDYRYGDYDLKQNASMFIMAAIMAGNKIRSISVQEAFDLSEQVTQENLKRRKLRKASSGR